MGPPTAQQWNRMFQVYAVCNLFLWIKYFASTMYAANKENHPEEDKNFVGDIKIPDDMKRRERAFLNDLENIPFHTAIFWGAFIVQCFANMNNFGENETIALTVLIALYSAFRLLYTFCYAFALQPFRTLVFLFANICVLIASCIMISSAYNVDTSNFLL